MTNPNTFEEASAATQDLFADNEQLSLADVPPADEENSPAQSEQNAENTPAEAAPTGTEEPTAATPQAEQPDTTIEQAAETAEVAAQVAAEKDGQLQQAMAEIESLKQQNQQLQGTIDEISRQNTENIIEDALTPPTLDINALAFADEEMQRAAMAKYAEDMSAYNRQQLMKEMSPALEYAKKSMRDAETKEVVSTLSQIPELANIEGMLPQLDRIIANNKWLSSDDMPIDEKYINAYAIARGIDTINNPPTQPEPPKEPTPEELLQMYNNNPAFQELVEKQRIDTLKQGQQVPPFSASSGAVSAALNIKEKPKTIEEASERTRKMFGL
ncbi:MAG: hypothetical protein PUF08_07640 [Clostridiales bacterium]|nr:hypothetical protein [Clostridiales bacterium]